MIHLYYYAPLTLNHHSAQTIQILQDYGSLAAKGYKIFLFGQTNSESDPNLINGPPFKFTTSSRHPSLIRAKFLYKLIRDPHPKVIVTRNSNKTEEIQKVKPLLKNAALLLERHEDAIPYWVKNWNETKKQKEKKRWEKLLKKVDGLVLTSYPQAEAFEEEFTSLPPYAVLPNGVDLTQFSQALPSEPFPEQYVLTYTGQFTAWKNVELLFASLAQLDRRYTLRIAGGKTHDPSSKRLINQYIQKYQIDPGRVDFRGFLPRHRLIPDVINGSSVLLLPLGDNVESRLFTSPMKLFEYMATPIPVVTINFPSISTIAGEEAFFLSDTNPDSFASAIRMAAQNGPERQMRVKEMNAQCKLYSLERRAEQLDTFIRSCHPSLTYASSAS